MSKAKRNRQIRRLANELVRESPEYAQTKTNGALHPKSVAKGIRKRRSQ